MIYKHNKNGGVKKTEREILLYIQNYTKNDLFDVLMPGISFLSDLGWIWILSAAILMLSEKYRKYGFALSLGLFFCFVIGNITLKPLFARVRPYDVYEDFVIMIESLRDFSFPSGHTYIAFCGAMVLLAANRKIGYAAFTLAVLTAFSRLYLLVHYPSDVIAGAVLGILIGYLAVRCIELLQKSFAEKSKTLP